MRLQHCHSALHVRWLSAYLFQHNVNQHVVYTRQACACRIRREQGSSSFISVSGACYSATLTAALAVGQPTSLSAPLVPCSLAVPAPYPPTHTSDATSTSPA